MKVIASLKIMSLILICSSVVTFTKPIFSQIGKPPLSSTQDDRGGKAYALFSEAKELVEPPPSGKNDYRGTFQSKTAAIQKFEQAGRLFQEIGDIDYEISCLRWIGGIYLEFGEFSSAINYFDQSLTALKRKFAGEDKKSLDNNNRGLESELLNDLGVAYDRLGEKQKALDLYNQSLILDELYRKNLKNDSWYRVFNLQITDRIIVKRNNIGNIYNELGEGQKALDYFNVTLNICHEREGNKDKCEYQIFNYIGTVYYSLRQDQKALEYFNKSLDICRKYGDLYQSGTALALGNIGNVYFSLGEYEKSSNYFTESLLIFKWTGETISEAITLGKMSRARQVQKKLRLAAFYGKQSVNIFQTFRRSIKGLDKETQQTFLKSVSNNYRYLSEILIADGRLNEAVQVLNSFKDQQFFDLDTDSQIKDTKIKLTLRETEFADLYEKAGGRVGTITLQLAEMSKKIRGDRRKPTADEMKLGQRLEKELETAPNEFPNALKQTEIEFSKPADEKDKVSDVSDIREMQNGLRNLNRQTGQKTVAIYLLVGEDNFRALIVSPDNIKDVLFSIKGIDLNNKALKLWGLLQSDKYDTTVLSKQIYDIVFAPIEKELPKDATTIMWSLDGNLRYLPMAVLFDGKRFLAERFNHVNFTRVDSDRLIRANTRNWTGTGFGTSSAQTVELLGDKISFTSLPGVNEELKEIFKQSNSKTGILSGEVLQDKRFTKMGFLNALKQKRPVVHIASHFSFRPGDNERSFLLLGNGTILTLNEMKTETNLFQGVDLLTLSACNTAAAQADANGREIDGFAELAQRLGANTVLATLWSVADSSTPWLMRDFYAAKQGKLEMNKAEALRKSQLALINGTAKTKSLPVGEKEFPVAKPQVVVSKSSRRKGNKTRTDIIYLDEAEASLFKKDEKKPFAHPYYWSPFILFGNWR